MASAHVFCCFGAIGSSIGLVRGDLMSRKSHDTTVVVMDGYKGGEEEG